MRKAGGIIAIIAGIFGVMAAIVTLFVGGVGSAFHADKANLVVNLGWGGIVFSFCCIVLGAVCMAARSSLPGLLLIFSSNCGIVLGGTIVAIFMGLALIGGLLACFGGKSQQEPTSATFVGRDHRSQFGEEDADEIICRYLREPKPADNINASSAQAAGFGKRRQI